MGIVRRNRTFLVTAVLILVVGALIFGGVIAVRVMAEGTTTTPAAPAAPANYNSVSSFGITGYAPLTVSRHRRHPRASSPSASRSSAASSCSSTWRARPTTWRCCSTSTTIKAQYAADARSSTSRRASPRARRPARPAQVSDPPILAIIDGDGQGVRALHRLDRPEGAWSSASPTPSAASKQPADDHIRRRPSGRRFCLTAVRPRGTIMPTFSVGICPRRSGADAHLLTLRIRPAGHGVPGGATQAGPVPLPEIAQREAIPAPFLERILARLRRERPGARHARRERRLPARPRRPPTSPSATW